MSLFLQTKSVLDSSAADVHLLGCNIEHTGDARVAQFFQTSIRKSSSNTAKGSGEISATFRGRPLCGKLLDVPTGYTGLVLKENQRPFMEDEDRELHATSNFKTLTYWNLDTVPTANDVVVKAMVWPEIAHAIHNTVQNGSQEFKGHNI